MNQQQYFEYHESALRRMSKITRAKNSDYAGAAGDLDPFANFRNVEKLNICSTEQGFLTRMTDKLSRLSTFVQKGILQVKDESVEDTLLDLANYCILMAAYLTAKRNKTKDADDLPF